MRQKATRRAGGRATDRKTALRAAGELIAARRARREWTQAQLAKRLGLSQSAVSHVETGRASPARALAVLRALGSVPRELGGRLREAGK